MPDLNKISSTLLSEEPFQEKTSWGALGHLSELEQFAAGVHGAMAAGYALTLPYHLRRGNWLYLGIGIIGASFHVWSVFNHLDRED